MIWLLLLVVGGLVLIWTLAVPLGIGMLWRDGKLRERAQANAPAVLDAAFTGQPHVVFEVTARSLPFEDVVLGARDRGYELLTQTDTEAGKTLVFTRRP